MKRIIKLIFLSVFVISIGYLAAVFFSSQSRKVEPKETAATISNEKEKGQVLGEEEFSSSSVASKFFASQNFQASDVSLGGQALVFPSGQQFLAPAISDLRSELLATKNDGAVKFIVTWKTNKPCLSSIEYKKEGEVQGKKVVENDYGYIHSATLSPLAFSTSYSYTVSARDKWGNETQSEKLVFYTGAPNVSILDLLGSAFKDMFGWTRK